VQPEATLIVDLRPDHKEILAHMKPKGRYNIALAERHDLHVAESRDIDGFYSILQSTAGRDHFALHPKSQYKAFLEVLPGSFLLLSGTPGEAQKPIAGLLGVTWGNTGYYYYGASLHAYRALMAPYVLQWAAMRLCKARGCTQYDLLGVAPPDAGEGHPWRGITSFKEKFGGERVTYPPEQQYTLRPMAALILTVKRKMLG
jgi:lipid II:glycine glycyltransferase (peptidoglycan interpeptide bridge formation enzyme)